MLRCLSWVVFLPLLWFSPTAVGERSAPDENAVTDVTDGHAIVNALIAIPTIGERLGADGLTVGRMTRQVVEAGVTEYVLHVRTCAMCNPGLAKSGFVTITADERPTYMDGPVEYAVSFTIENVNPDESK